MTVTLRVWRQAGPKEKGEFKNYQVETDTDTSFLETLDILNEQLVEKKEEPIAFDSDCREGICGMCSLYINGHPHGPATGATTCQLYMRRFKNGETITVEPWRSAAFPVIKDLIVDRNAFDKIQQAGGYVSFNCGGAQDANNLPISKVAADMAMDSATCIGCGACVAACKNGSAMLFVSAKVSQFALLPPGPGRACPPCPQDGSQDGRTRLRQLHQHRCLRSGMPQKHLPEQHCPPQPRVHQGKVR